MSRKKFSLTETPNLKNIKQVVVIKKKAFQQRNKKHCNLLKWVCCHTLSVISKNNRSVMAPQFTR